MPYHLKKKPGTNLYWVAGESGNHLSHAPMSLERAKKQLIAANISYAREKGYIPPR